MPTFDQVLGYITSFMGQLPGVNSVILGGMIAAVAVGIAFQILDRLNRR